MPPGCVLSAAGGLSINLAGFSPLCVASPSRLHFVVLSLDIFVLYLAFPQFNTAPLSSFHFVVSLYSSSFYFIPPFPFRFLLSPFCIQSFLFVPAAFPWASIMPGVINLNSAESCKGRIWHCLWKASVLKNNINAVNMVSGTSKQKTYST